MTIVVDAGQVYKIGTVTSKPAHYYIVLNDPSPLYGNVLVVSLTDRHNFLSNTDIWPLAYYLCPDLTLAKPSVVALSYAAVVNQSWFEKEGVEYVGRSTPEALQRARCNMIWFSQFLRPDVKRISSSHENEWKVPCGPVPQGKPKITNNNNP